MKKNKVRVSCHGKRIVEARHNDRNNLDYTKEKNAHIDTELSKENVYWIAFKDFKDKKLTFEQAELLFYERAFGQSIIAQNTRNARRGQKQRNKTIKDVLYNKKTAPDEFIFQIGDVVVQETWNERTREKMKKISVQAVFNTYKEIRKKFKGIRLLNLALHLDEEGGMHVHARWVYYAKDTYGYWFPRQRQALENAGYERPDPTKPISRYNNPKITFTNHLRETFLEKTRELIKENNLDIKIQDIQHPIIPQKHLNTRDYKKMIDNYKEEKILEKEL